MNFVCPKHAGHLTLSIDACASMYRRGKKAEKWQTIAICQGCEIGAKHAGEALPPLAPATLQCCRCGRMARRLLRQQLCVSCYNRERERRIGRDRRGKPPLSAPPILTLSLLAGPVQTVTRPAANLLELALWIARATPGMLMARTVPYGTPQEPTLVPGLPACSRPVLRHTRPLRDATAPIVYVPPIQTLPHAPQVGAVLSRPVPSLSIESFSWWSGV